MQPWSRFLKGSDILNMEYGNAIQLGLFMNGEKKHLPLVLEPPALAHQYTNNNKAIKIRAALLRIDHKAIFLAKAPL